MDLVSTWIGDYKEIPGSQAKLGSYGKKIMATPFCIPKMAKFAMFLEVRLSSKNL